MTSTSDLRTPPRRSWGRILLVTALILSIFLNAIALGAWLRLRELRGVFMGEGSAMNVLPADMRRDLRAAVTANADRLMPLVRDLAKARAAAFAAATAEPHDRAATEAAVTEFRLQLDALILAVTPIILDRLDEMSEG